MILLFCFRRELRYKVIVKYGGYFKSINKGTRRKYYFGRQRTIYFDKQIYGFAELFEEVSSLYPFDEDQNFLLFYEDKRTQNQSFIQLEHDESFELMLDMYKEKQILIYVTKERIVMLEDENIIDGVEVENEEFGNYEEGSDYCHSEASYHSRYSDTEEEDEVEINYECEGEFYLYDKDNPKMEVGAKFPDVVAFRRALNHHAICNDFEYDLGKSEPARVTATCSDFECSWRIHAAVAEDGVTFVIKTIQPKHECCGVNRRGNKHATQGWIANQIVSDLRKEKDIPPKRLQVSLETKFGISLPYNRVWEGKELALKEIYGEWDDSFEQISALKEEILKRNSGSVVEFKTELGEGEKQHFQRFFVSHGACISGFLKGCRPYISLDACHLKGKWKGVLAAATAIDGNN
jgi:MuDR family transposase